MMMCIIPFLSVLWCAQFVIQSSSMCIYGSPANESALWTPCIRSLAANDLDNRDNHDTHWTFQMNMSNSGGDESFRGVDFVPLRTAGIIEQVRVLSKSQHKEDIHLLEYYPQISLRENLTVLESGAFTGFYLSNTWALEKVLNWNCVHIEASPLNFAALQKNRPESVNIHRVLCSSEETLHWVSHRPEGSQVDGIWEYMSPLFRQKFYGTKTQLPQNAFSVQCQRIDVLIQEYNFQPDVWFLDIEGAEASVLRGIDWSLFHPCIIVKETGKPDGNEPEALNILLRVGYSRIEQWGHSSWYVNPRFCSL